MRLPRNVDVRSLAAILFAFVVVVVFSGLIVIGVSCRFLGTACVGDNTQSLESIKALTENIIAVLLALMVGSRPIPPSDG